MGKRTNKVQRVVHKACAPVAYSSCRSCWDIHGSDDHVRHTQHTCVPISRKRRKVGQSRKAKITNKL